MQAALEAGDVVMTTSGLRGTIVDASYEDTIDIEIADGVVTTWVRGAVREKVQTGADDTATPDSTSDSTSDKASEDVPSNAAAPDLGRAPSLEKSAVEKDESSNGTTRS
jgi:preprotein translocase subunit YajC